MVHTKHKHCDYAQKTDFSFYNCYIDDNSLHYKSSIAAPLPTVAAIER